MQNSTSKSNASRRSWPIRFFYWLFSWRIIRRCLVALAGLITLVALVWAEENWRGKRAWENYKREWEAKGEKFDLKNFVPPPVPDEQNFAMTPFLAPLFDLNKNQKPGESRLRDTNAVKAIQDYAGDIGTTKVSAGWNVEQRMDLTAWASALDGKKDVPASGETASARATAGEIVYQKMKKYEPVLEELRSASRRGSCRFNIGYDAEDPIAVLLPHLAVLKKLSNLYRLRAVAEVAAGKNDAAIADIKMGIYLAEGTKLEPILISGLVRIAILNITLQPVWEGLADRRWTDAQLKELQQELGAVDLLKGYELTMRGERAFDNGEIEYQRRTRRMQSLSDNGDTRYDTLNLMPSGFFYQNQLTINRMFQDISLPPVDSAKHRIYPELSTNGVDRLNKELQGGFIGYTIFAQLLLPALAKAENKFATTQAALDEALVACALERYQLAHGQFPETLEVLSPQFIEKLPPDLLTGEPLKYRRTQDGQFILYSIGWNGVDDGGTVAMTKGETPRNDPTQGDWVWRYPGK